MPTIEELRDANQSLINPIGTVDGIPSSQHREMNDQMIDWMESASKKSFKISATAGNSISDSRLIGVQEDDIVVIMINDFGINQGFTKSTQSPTVNFQGVEFAGGEKVSFLIATA